ncbi:hypothetical protein KC949_00080 [Candidatus Saccharibacteria bacterium]|nr:hypothetical protein [Candidatus Saccharibacteria bacterium]
MKMRGKFIAGAAMVMMLGVSACSNTQPSEPPITITVMPTPQTTSVQPTQTTSEPASPSETTQVTNCSSETGQWNTEPDSTDVRQGFGEVLDVRTARHECFDRVVIETTTLDEVGFQVQYVPQVTREGSGEPVPVPGAAVLQVTVDTWGYNFTRCQVAAGWESLRDVQCAGTHEGQTAFALGVSARKPFAVYHLPNPNKGTMRVVIDIAH